MAANAGMLAGQPPELQRLMFIDGLRGLAAMAVVIHHFRGAINTIASDWIWPFLDTLFYFGYLGVDVFFVISGFVIPFSILRANHTLGFLGRFALRRSIRLDPPYWAAIALELVLIYVGLSLFPALETPIPSLEQILAHLIYAQHILGYGSIVAIFWTLCHEVQFYLFAVGSLVILRSLRLRFGTGFAGLLFRGTAAAVFIYSVLIFFGPLDNPLRGLFINRWYQFFLGALAMLCFLRKSILPSFVIASLFVVAGSIYSPQGADNGLTAVLTSWLMVMAGLRNKMNVWLSGSVNRFLGRVSYSLYLINPIIGWRFMKLLAMMHGEEPSVLGAWLILAAGIAVSVLSAWLMYILIEAKSLKACRSIDMNVPLTTASVRNAIHGFVR